MLLRLVYLIFFGVFLCAGQYNVQILSTNPELVEGPWETTGASGIDGIFLTIRTGLNWQTIDIRVHHRVNGKETWGYFATREKATTESYSMAPGRNLPRGTNMKIVGRLLCAMLLLGPALFGQSGRATVCVAPNSPDPPTRTSPGGLYNPVTLSLKIDKNPPIRWPHKDSIKIGDLDVNQRHLVVLTSDGKKIQYFWLRFSEYKTTDLSISFDGYQGVQLDDRKSAPWCKCKSRKSRFAVL